MQSMVWAAALAIGGAGDETIEWQSDLTQAATLAKKSGQPLFAVFRCER